ncbi:hypothetical protein RvY_03308-2 [Ramazzottius varieornatus]|uniref:Uncharacterized protein n=1 Tax=Ramazzottius varieornatus TaxID=947166 RepID=A0A1D1UX05_RAMVA|nr:hypothetical protein RvY_03308-2 [Ramazzottius varieornatus]
MLASPLQQRLPLFLIFPQSFLDKLQAWFSRIPSTGFYLSAIPFIPLLIPCSGFGPAIRQSLLSDASSGIFLLILLMLKVTLADRRTGRNACTRNLLVAFEMAGLIFHPYME